jgi:hypothetical protein
VVSSGFQPKSCRHLPSPPCATCPAHLVLLDLITDQPIDRSTLCVHEAALQSALV